MKFLTAAVLLVTVATAAVASPGRGGGRGGGGGGGRGGGSSACKTSFPGYAEPLRVFTETGQATQDLKCYMSCVLQAKGLMESNGTITMKDPASSRVTEAFKTATASCFQQTPTSDLCETAYVHNKCLWDTDTTKSFLRIFQ
ncbi:uncharacterized protein LOC117649372 [Thrips palmi]|uniref:Uncharacterized protein LOC117649372 n=1 Tax=Thrips palmi TaxID=161013 RepID=A0A6P8ZRX6_THRPL|nr:uncharacterized protein LOC117649372 [Thrips palmi]